MKVHVVVFAAVKTLGIFSQRVCPLVIIVHINGPTTEIWLNKIQPRNLPPIAIYVGLTRINEERECQVPSPPENNPWILGCLDVGNYLPNRLPIPHGRIVGMSSPCPLRPHWSRHPRDLQHTTNFLLVSLIALLIVDSLRSKVKFYKRDIRIYCLKKSQNAPRPSEHPPVRGEKCQNV